MAIPRVDLHKSAISLGLDHVVEEVPLVLDHGHILKLGDIIVIAVAIEVLIGIFTLLVVLVNTLNELSSVDLVLMLKNNVNLEIRVADKLLRWSHICLDYQVLFLIERFILDEMRRLQECYLRILVEGVEEYQVEMNFVPNSTGKKHIGTAIDPHGIWVEPKVFIMIKVHET